MTEQVLFDFESGDIEDWSVEGERDEHALRVVETDEAAEWEYDSVGWEGDYLLAAGAGRHEFHEDVTIESPEFEVSADYLRFLLAGELHPTVKVALVVGGEPVREAFGNNAYDATPRGWDVGDLRGETARLRVVDHHPRRSLLRLDHVRLSDEAPPELGSFDLERRTESELVRTGEFELIVPMADYDEELAVYNSSFVHGHDDRWHCYASVAPVQDEFSFEDTCTSIVHASADELDGEWTVHGETLAADEEFGEDHAAHPHVVFHDGRYFMFYVGEMTPFRGFYELRPNEEPMYDGEFGPIGPNRVCLAVSEDGEEWVRHPDNPLFGQDAFCYHPYVVHLGGDADVPGDDPAAPDPEDPEWAVYYQVTDDDTASGRFSVARRTSEDLQRWSEPELVFSHEEAMEGYSKDPGKNNPNVFRRGEDWYMLTGNIRQDLPSRFHVSRVFRSADHGYWPADTPSDGAVYVDGGPEPVRDADGDWHISHANAMSGGVWLAPLYWNDGNADDDTNIDAPGTR